jgi:hypothetical protein
VFGKKKGFFFFFARKIAGVWPEGAAGGKSRRLLVPAADGGGC